MRSFWKLRNDRRITKEQRLPDPAIYCTLLLIPAIASNAVSPFHRFDLQQDGGGIVTADELQAVCLKSKYPAWAY
jgi:hypothetical protein